MRSILLGLVLLMAPGAEALGEPALIADASLLAGGAVVPVSAFDDTGEDSDPGSGKLTLQVGVESRGGLRLGVAAHLSLGSSQELAIPFRATWWWSRCWSARLGLGPLVTCDRCRGVMQDTGFVARGGVGHSSGIAVEIEARLLAFDLGREIRPLGTELTIFAGVTVMSAGSSSSPRTGSALELDGGVGFARVNHRQGALHGFHSLLAVGVGRWMTPSLALTFRLSGHLPTLFAERVDEDVKAVLVGPSLQYWRDDHFWIAGTVGVARVGFALSDYGEVLVGVGGSARAGYAQRINSYMTLKASLQVDASYIGTITALGFGALVGYQY